MARSSGTSVINFPGAGGGTSYLLIIGAIITIVGLYIFIKRNPNFLKNLLGGLGGGKIGAAVGGNTATGWDIYTPAEEESTITQSGEGHRVNQEIGCNESKALSQRENHSFTATNYEATGIIQLQSGDTCNCGDEFDIKILGPEHSGSPDDNPHCCWWIFGVPSGCVEYEQKILTF